MADRPEVGCRRLVIASLGAMCLIVTLELVTVTTMLSGTTGDVKTVTRLCGIAVMAKVEGFGGGMPIAGRLGCEQDEAWQVLDQRTLGLLGCVTSDGRRKSALYAIRAFNERCSRANLPPSVREALRLGYVEAIESQGVEVTRTYLDRAWDLCLDLLTDGIDRLGEDTGVRGTLDVASQRETNEVTTVGSMP